MTDLRLTIKGPAQSFHPQDHMSGMKRDFQQHYQEQVEEMVETVMVPARLVPSIVGKGGSSIKELQRVSGCNIQTGEKSNDEDRAITISGRPQGVLIGQVLVLQKVIHMCSCNEQDYPDLTVRNIMEITVPASKCSILIGKQGMNIKYLQETAGVNLQIPKDNLSEEVACTVEGTVLQGTLLKILIQHLLENRKYTGSGSMMSTPREGQNFGFSDQGNFEDNRNNMSHRDEGEPHMWGGKSGIGSGMSGLRGPRMHGSMAPPSMGGMHMGGGMSQMGDVDRMENYGRAPPMRHERFERGDGQHRSNPYNRFDERKQRPMYGMQNDGMFEMRQGAQMSGMDRGGQNYGSQPLTANKMEILVDAKFVALKLIGKGGSIINQLQQECGAKVQVVRDSGVMINRVQDPRAQMAMKVVEIQGDRDNQVEAVKRVSELMDTPDLLMVKIPKVGCGIVVGKRGSNIQELNKIAPDVDVQVRDTNTGEGAVIFSGPDWTETLARTIDMLLENFNRNS